MKKSFFAISTSVKHTLTILFFTISFATLSFCQTQSCLQNANYPGYQSIMQIVDTDTIVREYILHVPIDYNMDNPAPLIINLHGFGDCAFDYADQVGNFYGFNALADQENFLVAYPQGAYRPEKEDTYWEPGDNGGANIFENDVYFMEQLIADVSNNFNVDANKIYACGYSNGGMMAYSLACNNTDLYAAIGIMSGTMLDEDCNFDKAIPIIKFHGIADGVLPYEGNVWYQSVAEVVDFWLNENNIPSSSLLSTELNDGKVVRDEYNGGDENSCLTLYTIREEWDKPGDHVWFSDQIDGSTPNQLMWKFFNENCSVLNSTEANFTSAMDLNIGPNPFLNQIIITTQSEHNQPFTIYNIHGELQYSGIMNTSPYIVDLPALPSNVYLIKLGGEIRKLIKLN